MVQEAADAVERAGFAEDNHAFEERWAGGAAGKDRAAEHEVFFDRPLFCGACGTEGGVKSFYGPVAGLEGGEGVGGEGEGLFQGAFFGEEDLGRGDDIVAEEEVCEVAELGEGFDAGLDEGGDGSQVVV